MNQLRNPDLGGTVGADQTGVGDEGQGFPRFGMLDLIEQDCREQHRVDAISRRLAVDIALQRAQLIQGAGPQRLKLVDSVGEQLGERCLRAVHPEADLQHSQFLRGEIRRVPLLGDGLLRVLVRNGLSMVLPRQKHSRTGDKSQACQQWQSGLTQELTHEVQSWTGTTRHRN